jgi:hypothetical protein
MTGSVRDHVRRWWPVPVLIAIVIVVQKAFFESRYDVSGHAGEHLSGASVAFLAFAIVAILLYVTPRARRQPLVLATSAMWLVSTVLVLIGNVRVVDALIDAGMADTPTSQLGENATIDSAHDLANLAPWLGVLAALALTGVLWRYRHISGRVAAGAAVFSVIFPPWIIPGAGVIVVTIACCIAFHRASRTDRPSSSVVDHPARQRTSGGRTRAQSGPPQPSVSPTAAVNDPSVATAVSSSFGSMSATTNFARRNMANEPSDPTSPHVRYKNR